MCQLNFEAKDMLKKACEKENGKIVVYKSIDCDYIKINDEIISKNETNWMRQEAFIQLVDNKFVNRSMVSNNIIYEVTNEGYAYISNLNEDDVIAIT